MDNAALAKRFRSLGSLGAADLDAFASALKTRVLSPGQTLVEEGSAGDSVWLVWEGQLGVSLQVGRERVSLGRVGPGAIVGEVAFLDGGPASATISATTSSTVLGLGQPAFDAVMAKNPRAATAVHLALCRSLADHVRAASERVEELRSGMDTEMVDGAEPEGGILEALRSLLGFGDD